MQTAVATYNHTNPALFCGGSVVVDYYGIDNDDYVAGAGFCCEPQAQTKNARSIPTENVDYEKLQYYYHSDHLGSASYITNLDGEVVQHIEYVPFGEVFLDERNNTWNTPFLFNGKELDEETGLYYYGARYYNPRISLWYGVDPLNEERYGLSPYQYCQNNPVKLVDPTGMLDTNYKTEKGKLITSTKDGLDQDIIVPNERLDEFQQNVDATSQDGQNTIGWNNYWRDEFGGATISTEDSNLLGFYREWTDESQASLDFMQAPSLSTFKKFLGTRALSQFTSVDSWSVAVFFPLKNIAKGVGLSDDVARTFAGGRYSKVVLDKPMTLSRYYDNVNAFAKGRYMTNPSSITGFKFVDRMGLALKPQWNGMTKVANWNLPAGTTIYQGRAAMQFPWIGGRTQYFIPNLNNITRTIK